MGATRRRRMSASIQQDLKHQAPRSMSSLDSDELIQSLLNIAEANFVRLRRTCICASAPHRLAPDRLQTCYQHHHISAPDRRPSKYCLDRYTSTIRLRGELRRQTVDLHTVATRYRIFPARPHCRVRRRHEPRRLDLLPLACPRGTENLGLSFPA